MASRITQKGLWPRLIEPMCQSDGVAAPTRVALPTVWTVHVPDRPRGFSSKIRSTLTESPPKFLGRVPGTASLRIDSNHKEIFDSLYQSLSNSARWLALILLLAVMTPLEQMTAIIVIYRGLISSAHRPSKEEEPNLSNGMTSFRFEVFARDSEPHDSSAGKDKSKFQF
jgi:hypothetical protein